MSHDLSHNETAGFLRLTQISVSRNTLQPSLPYFHGIWYKYTVAYIIDIAYYVGSYIGVNIV